MKTILSHVNAVTSQRVLHNVDIILQEGKITQISPNPIPSNTPLPFVISTFVDLHIHGMNGFGPELGTSQALLDLSIQLARQGVGAFCPTLYCARPEKMAKQLRALVPAIGQEKGAHILGFHLEGPFISPQKPGVLKPQDIAPADLTTFEKIYEATQGHLAIVTLAPELPGIRPIIDFCLKHHILVQAGHTNATYEQMQTAFDWGVRRVTHLGNAMSGLHHRAPGVFGFALMNPQVSCEIIADGKHLHPAVLKLLRSLKTAGHITAVTDALLPTGQVQGPFYANGEEILLQDGVWKRKADGTWAGSCLTMLSALHQLTAVGYSLPQASNATHAYGVELPHFSAPDIAPGQPADLVLLSPQLRLERIFLHGREVSAQ